MPGLRARRALGAERPFQLGGILDEGPLLGKGSLEHVDGTVDGGTLAPDALTRDVANEGARLQRLHAAWTGVVSARHGMLRCRKEGSRGAASGRKPALSALSRTFGRN